MNERDLLKSVYDLAAIYKKSSWPM